MSYVVATICPKTATINEQQPFQDTTSMLTHNSLFYEQIVHKKIIKNLSII